MPSSLRYDARVIGVAARDLSGKLIATPTNTVLERLGKWGQHSTRKTWELKTALLLGLDGVRGGAFELSTFCFRPADPVTVVSGRVLEMRIYEDPRFGFPVLSVFALIEGYFWAILCRSQMYNPRNSYPVQLCGIPDGLIAKSFGSLPTGHDFGLDKFCELKAVSVEEEAKPEPEMPKVVTLSQSQLTKLGKRPLKLGGEKEHLALFYCEKVIPRCIEEAFVAGSQLGLLEVGVRDHFDLSLVDGWSKELNQVMMSLATFGGLFLPETDIPAEFLEAQYPHHKPVYCGKRLVPQLVQTLVEATKVLEALPIEMKPLVKDSDEANLAGKVSAAVAGIHKFVLLLRV